MGITGHYMALNDRYLKSIDYGDKFLLGVRVDDEIQEILDRILGDTELDVQERWKPTFDSEFVSRFNLNCYCNLYEFTTVGSLNIMLLPDNQNNLYVVIDKAFVNYEVYTNKLYYDTPDYNNVKLGANLLLELFKRVEALEYDLFSNTGSLLVTVPWEILPQGQSHEKDGKGNSKLTTDKEKSTEYIEYLKSQKPTMIAKGKDNYANYRVFKFKDSKYTILESEEYGNATYIINGDWKEITKLSRYEIKESRRGFAIIHDDIKLWIKKIEKYM